MIIDTVKIIIKTHNERKHDDASNGPHDHKKKGELTKHNKVNVDLWDPDDHGTIEMNGTAIALMRLTRLGM